LVVSLFSFFLGVMVGPTVKKVRKAAEEQAKAELESSSDSEEVTLA